MTCVEGEKQMHVRTGEVWAVWTAGIACLAELRPTVPSAVIPACHLPQLHLLSTTLLHLSSSISVLASS